MSSKDVFKIALDYRSTQFLKDFDAFVFLLHEDVIMFHWSNDNYYQAKGIHEVQSLYKEKVFDADNGAERIVFSNISIDDDNRATLKCEVHVDKNKKLVDITVLNLEWVDFLDCFKIIQIHTKVDISSTEGSFE